jgi:hypothetical protein
MTAKFMFAKAIRPDMAKVVPPAASSPATRNDPYFHDTANAAVASTIAPMPSTGASPGPAVRNSARPPIALVRKKASEAAASPTPITSFEFVVMARTTSLSILIIVHSCHVT